jgi:FtsZ-interacting cell division protein ZipA
MSNTVAIVLISVIAIAVIVLLIWKNKKDKKLLNPDSQDSVEEVMMDHDRRRDKI